MSTARRRGSESSETRGHLLDAAEKVMLADGYAAVSSRRIAKEVGVTPALVHYYFATLDDLFVAVVRRRTEQQLSHLRGLLDGPEPLHALWDFIRQPAGTALVLELMALANHREPVRAELAALADQFRAVQLDALSQHLERCGLDPEEVSPVAVLVAIESISRTLVMEESLGMSVGLAETDDAVRRYLDRFEGSASERRARWRRTARRRAG